MLRRIQSSATWAVNLRCRERSTSKTKDCAWVSPSAVARAIQTSPTGLSGVPPPGPEIPEVAIPKSLPNRSRTPSAIARTDASDTAPSLSITAAGTPSIAIFASFEYETTPPKKYAEEPGTSVNRSAISPPVQDSAVAIVRPRLTNSRPTTLSIVSVPSPYTTSPIRSRIAVTASAIFASASSIVAARATGRRKLSGKLVRKPNSTFPSRIRSPSSASSVDSPIPNVASKAARTTCFSRPPENSARRTPIRGITCSSIIRSSSRGTPGIAKKTACPGRASSPSLPPLRAASIEKPGAVPIGFSRTSASSGKKACFRFVSAISLPIRAKKASIAARDGG